MIELKSLLSLVWSLWNGSGLFGWVRLRLEDGPIGMMLRKQAMS